MQKIFGEHQGGLELPSVRYWRLEADGQDNFNVHKYQ